MRRSRSIFEDENYKITKRPMSCGISLLSMILCVISLVLAMLILINLDCVMEKIAIVVSEFLNIIVLFSIIIMIITNWVRRWLWRRRGY